MTMSPVANLATTAGVGLKRSAMERARCLGGQTHKRDLACSEKWLERRHQPRKRANKMTILVANAAALVMELCLGKQAAARWS